MTPIYYYGRQVDPSVLRNKGLRGRWILFLHRVSSWILRRIEWHIMIAFAKDRQLGEDVVTALKVRFKEENKESSGRRRSALAAFGIDGAGFRSSYEEPRTNAAEPKTPEQRAAEVSNDSLQRLARLATVRRRAKYGDSRETYSVNESFEPVE